MNIDYVFTEEWDIFLLHSFLTFIFLLRHTRFPELYSQLTSSCSPKKIIVTPQQHVIKSFSM
jgi:hypothetical protein